jgi:hypothetical protein
MDSEYRIYIFLSEYYITAILFCYIVYVGSRGSVVGIATG